MHKYIDTTTELYISLNLCFVVRTIDHIRIQNMQCLSF